MSRNDARSKSLLRRPSRAVPATLTAVVLGVVGALLAVAAVFRLAQGSWPSQVVGPARAVGGTTWGQPSVIAAGAALAFIGLILLIAALKPGSPNAARLASPPDAHTARTDYVISGRAVARLAAASADRVDGVERVSTSAGHRRVHLSVTTSSEQTDQIRQQLVDTVGARLSAAGLDPAPRVTASVRTRAL